MRVLLTGGAGFIGPHTALCLLEAGHEIVALDNLSNSSPGALKRVEELTGKKATLVVGDCTVEADVENAFAAFGPFDAVVHFAGFKAVGESVSMPLEYYRNNLDATLVLCKVMEKHGCRSLVFSSSATVYGTNPVMPLREDYPTGCTNPYGWTKWINERILTDYCFASKDMSVVLLRYFNPIGAHESGRIGEDPSGVPNNLMPYICQVASGKLEKLRVFGDDYDTRDGTGVRDYVHVVDLAEGHLAAMDYAAKNTGAEAVNLGTGCGSSVFEVLRAYEEACGKKLPYRITPRRPGDIGEYYAHPGKAEVLFGWKAKRDLKQMCADSWNYTKKTDNGKARLPEWKT